jgi:hypothetical protein
MKIYLSADNSTAFVAVDETPNLSGYSYIWVPSLDEQKQVDSLFEKTIWKKKNNHVFEHIPIAHTRNGYWTLKYLYVGTIDSTPIILDNLYDI